MPFADVNLCWLSEKVADVVLGSWLNISWVWIWLDRAVGLLQAFTGSSCLLSTVSDVWVHTWKDRKSKYWEPLELFQR